MLGHAVGTAKALAEITINPHEGEKIEPEQMRKNVTTILTLLIEIEDFLNEFNTNKCSSSDI